jgi:hypothetical protein
MAIEDYNEKVRFQQMLDATFPRGASVVIVWDVEGTIVPSGVELTVGRLMVEKAYLVDGEWVHDLLLDPSIDPVEQGFTIHVPVRSLHESSEFDDLWEAVTYTPDLLWEEIVRFREPTGPRRLKPGQREAITEIWEKRMFPDGILEKAQA